ncbi:hypothetical protein [Paenibacillus polymyxa]|uniref:hypothetical protein n=1 Tax=Paenibacillus polymyxa TaxID=1406 RepID=UPI00111B8639|nr:hypothetical protein [Paenibacillus polymyxa]QDA30265.1 hypothetical protein FGY93_25475 [Paenibacillus polymyxa]
MLTATGKANIEHMLPGEQVTVGGPAAGENVRYEVYRYESEFVVKVFDHLVLLDNESISTAAEVIKYIERF